MESTNRWTSISKSDGVARIPWACNRQYDGALVYFPESWADSTARARTRPARDALPSPAISTKRA